MNKKAVFLDIDGTLIPLGRDSIAEEDLEQIEVFHKAGHRFFLNTGRSLANISAEMLNAPWVDGVVAGSGAHILLREKNGNLKTVYRKFISPALLVKICAYYLEAGVWCLFEGETGVYALNRPSLIAAAMFEPLPVKSGDDFATVYKNTRITKLTIGGETGAKEKEVLGGEIEFYPQKGYHEGIIKGESKSNGIRLVLEALDMSREQSVAIGDSANDLDMIRFAGAGIAMGNSCEELKAAAVYITASAEQCGVARALRRYLGSVYT